MKESHAVKSAEVSPHATYQDVLDAPPHMVAEIVDGKLYTHPRPALRHAIASSGLGNRIGTPFHFGDGGPGGWWIVFEPELHLGKDILVPDIAGVEFQIKLKRLIQIKSERNYSMNHIVPTKLSDSKSRQRGWRRCASAA